MTCPLAAFNSDPITFREIQNLQKISGASIAIETGTYLGNTTLALAQIFSEVHTVECMGERYIQAEQHLRRKAPNIHCHFGDSANILALLLPTLESTCAVFAYLDAHTGNWAEPIVQKEIRLLGHYFPDKTVIVIDDVIVPNEPGYLNDGIAYETIQKDLERAFPKGYYYYYNRRTEHPLGRPTGRLHILPSSLQLPEGWIVAVNGVPRSGL